MLVKLLEIRDRATFLPVYAILATPANEDQSYLLLRCGFAKTSTAIILGRLNCDSPASADAYFWNDRTMKRAHLYIDEHFHDLKDGDVVDVEFILGESDKPKISERF